MLFGFELFWLGIAAGTRLLPAIVFTVGMTSLSPRPRRDYSRNLSIDRNLEIAARRRSYGSYECYETIDPGICCCIAVVGKACH